MKRIDYIYKVSLRQMHTADTVDLNDTDNNIVQFNWIQANINVIILSEMGVIAI